MPSIWASRLAAWSRRVSVEVPAVARDGVAEPDRVPNIAPIARAATIVTRLIIRLVFPMRARLVGVWNRTSKERELLKGAKAIKGSE